MRKQDLALLNKETSCPQAFALFVSSLADLPNSTLSAWGSAKSKIFKLSSRRDFMGDSDPSIDPELAMALALSMREAGATTASAAPQSRLQADVDEDQELAAVLALSLQESMSVLRTDQGYLSFLAVVK
jgi:hypothetical protein